MSDLEEQLLQLVRETCCHAPGTLGRQRGLNCLIRSIQRSQKLWRDSCPDYEDALQKTWFYVCCNLCEATSAKEAFDPTQGSVLTWINAYLKRRIQDQWIEAAQKKSIQKDPQIVDGEIIDPVNSLPASPEPPAILEDVEEWVKREAKQLRRIYIRNRPDVNCEVLILRRLPPATSWDDLAKEFQLPASTLSSFYQRECFPRLINFGKSQGYVEETG